MNERQLTLHTPSLSGDQKLMVRRVEGHEALSNLFSYEVMLYARSESVDFDAVLGQEMCIGLEQPNKKERFFHGFVASFANVGQEGEFALYRAELRPHLWRLTRASNCRIFQNETVPAIVKKVLDEHGIGDLETHYGTGNRGPYLPWEYCVQYRESDFAFVSRLLEYEGIHYSFKHEKGRHVLVLADANLTHEPVPGYETVEYTRAVNMHNRREETVWEWKQQRSVLPGRATVTDYDFRTPKADLKGESGSEVKRNHDHADYEVYDHLETVVQQSGYSVQTSADYARMRSEELHTRYESIHAQTDARGVCTGGVLKLRHGPGQVDKERFLITSTLITADNDARSSHESAAGNVVYQCSFQAIDMKHPFRPARVTPKPVVPGPQSATVAGKSGQDFWTDEWGRIRVKFHWDRVGKGDENSSCWVRVSQASAGTTWGSMFVPHIGQEVLVGFIEGDPDRPVVVGTVYNGSNKPPAGLPANGYKSVIRDFFGNEIVMDSTPGKEHMALYSPSHTSSLQLGKSIKHFTKSKDASYSYDSESYSFGSKKSFSKGNTLSVDRGSSFSVKASAGVGVTVGTDIKASISHTLEFKAGTSLSWVLSHSVQFGFSRDFKDVTGTYKRVSKGDALLDSRKKAFVCGGENDNTMLVSDDKELILSFDDSNGGRGGEQSKLDGVAKKGAAAMAVLGAAGAGLGAFTYNYEVNQARKGEKWDADGKHAHIDMETEKISGLGMGDWNMGMSAIATLGTAKLMADQDMPNPQHKSPTAKITVAKNAVRIFAGKGQETHVKLNDKAGFSVLAEKAVTLKSKSDAMTLTAAKEIKLKSDAAVNIDAVLKHRNMVVSK